MVIVNFSKSRKNKDGIKNFLGDLESDVMDVVWEMGECSVRDVHQELCQQRTIAYTTVMTIMSRLSEKEILMKEKVKKANYYKPVYSKEEFVEVCVGELIEGVAGKYTQPVLTCFVEKMAELDPSSLGELEKLIDLRKSGEEKSE